MADVDVFKMLKNSDDIYVKKYYEMPDFMIFYQCEKSPTTKVLDYVKSVQEILEKEGKKPRVLFNCEAKPEPNRINHFFSVIGHKLATDDWWSYTNTECMWIRDAACDKYKPEELVELLHKGETAPNEEYYLYLYK